MDGWIIIGTDLDTKNFDAEIKDVENQLKELEEKQKILQKYNRAKDKRAEGNITQYTQKNLDELHEYGLTLDDIGNKTTWQKLSAQIENLSNKYIDLNKKQNGLSDVEEKTNSINLNLDKTIKKVGRWAMAVFGVRSAYNLVRKAVSTISQYDEQLGADINYMSVALASTLEPVVRRIVDLAHTLMTYIAYIIKAWTGQNIFKNANKYLQKSVGSAKQLRKELASFDEMNVLNDNSSGGAGGALPSFDLSKPEDVPIPSWLQWIVDNKEVVLATLAGIASGLVAIKLGLDPLKALGIGLTIQGIILLMQDLITYMSLLDSSLEENGTNWEKFGKILTDIGLIILGVGITTGNLPLAIAGAIALIVGYVVQNWDTIKSKLEEAHGWINDQIDKLEERIDKFFGKIPVISGTIKGFLYFILENVRGVADFIHDYIIDTFSQMIKPIKNILDGILLIFKGDFKGGITSIMKGIGNFIIGTINKLIDGFNLFLTPLRAAIVAVGKVTGQNWSMGTIKVPRIPYLAKGGIINMPGQGVSLGSAIAGERGREAVLPLTDSQQMALLGQEIAKNIVINATVVNSMNGRVLSRELQRVQNEDTFAFNR